MIQSIRDAIVNRVDITGGGGVTSVNGQTGVVVLTASDVGAPSGSGTSTGTNTGDQTTSGTSNRITVTNGTTNPNIDIAATYVGQTSITTLGTVGTGTWQGGVVAGQYGGTGVANTGKTITLGGDFATSGAFASTFTLTNTTNVTLPTTGTLSTIAGTETFTNKRITKREVSVSDATSITPNADTSDTVTQANTQALGTLTMNAPTGTPTASQPLLIRIKSTNVQTFSWNAIYRGGTTALPTATSGSSKTDYYAFIYNSTDSKWDYTGGAVGFA